MKPQSAKAKGRRFQQEVANSIKKYLPHLKDNDVRSTSMGANGEDIVLSPCAEEAFPYTVECKNTEKLNVWAAIQQSESNVSRQRTPIVAIKKNRHPAYAVVPWDHFMTLVASQIRSKADNPPL